MYPANYLKRFKHLRQKEICFELGISRTTLWSWEKLGLPSHRPTRNAIYIKEEVFDWVRSQPSLNEKFYDKLNSKQ